MKVEAVIAPGVYRMENGSFRVVARVGDRKTGPRPKEKRFPAGTAPRTMRKWQEDQRAEMRRLDIRPATGTLADDIGRYLQEVSQSVRFIKDREREIKAWLPAFGHRHRHTIQPQDIREQLREWRKTYAPHTCNLRRSALSHLFTTLDGQNAYNPLKEVAKFAEPRPTPKWLPYEVIEKTFAVMRDCPTKARLMLMAYAGFRPSEIVRAQTEDVLPFLELPEPFCFKRVGKGGVPVMVPLPSKGVEAWRLLIARNGWGRFQHANVNRDWKRAMTRAGELEVQAVTEAGADTAVIEKVRLMFRPVNCYRLRHSYSVRLLLACGNKEVVQKALGHARIQTTDIYTTMVVDPRLQDAVRRAFGT
jgi:site-specific recombinase XerD